MASLSFKEQHTFENRKAEGERIRVKYPTRVPVIVQRVAGNDIPLIDKAKFLTPHDLTVAQFHFVIRKRLKLSADQAIFLFVNNTLPAASATMSQLYKEHASSDNFLYLDYSGESVFGQEC